MLWNLKKIREEIDACLAQVDAIVATAKDENRDVTAEEAVEIDAIQGTADKGGKLQELYAAEKRAERFTLTQQARAAAIGANVLPNQAGGGGNGPDGEPSGMIKAVKVPATAKRHGSLKHFKGPDAEANAYLSGRFLMAAINGDQKSKMWLQDHGVSMQHSSDDNSKGGYLVPEVLENVMIDLKEEYGMFRRYAANWPMTSDVSLVPRRVSGFTTYFVGQNDTITPSTTALDQVRLEAKKLAAMTQFSSELSEDAIISVADFYAREFAYALAVKEDSCGFLGDGTSTYGGITGVANALAAGSIVTATGITDIANLVIGTFQTAVGKLPEFPGIQPAWYVHKAIYHASMGRLQMAAGGNTVQDLGSGPVLQFMGYPVRFIQTLPATAATTTKIAYFGDLAMAATMGTRRGVTLRADESIYFAQDALALRVTERFDINVHERGTASVAGPLIMIQMG
jgi:HK97 family phage major capsid protein